MGTTAVDRKNRIGRRERREILKNMQGRGVDKGQEEPLRPNTILRALEENIARRYHEVQIWPAFLDQFWIRRRVIGRM